MPERTETPGETVIRKGIEKSITGFNNAGDERMANHWLDRWPYNKERPTPSLETIRHMQKVAVRNAGQDTEEMPRVVA